MPFVSVACEVGTVKIYQRAKAQVILQPAFNAANFLIWVFFAWYDFSTVVFHCFPQGGAFGFHPVNVQAGVHF